MKGIPPEIDQLMWQIAERADAKAAADFGQRFPHLSQALSDRMRMVGGMRSMRAAIAPTTIPAFSPKFLFRPVPRWKRYGPAAVGLFALASASFYITENLVTPLPESEIFLEAPHGRTSMPPSATPVPVPYRPMDPDGPKPYDSPIKPQRPGLRLTGSRVPLRKVMQQIAAQDKLTLDLPKDLPNPTIDVDIRAKSGLELLRQLGGQYGFRAVDEGKGHVVILSASNELPPDP